MKIIIDQAIKSIFPNLQMGLVLADVEVKLSDNRLQNTMEKLCVDKMQQFTPELIREQSIVKLTKNAYRKLGKDPNRYRPSAESLLRRVASGKGLYQVNNAVDILNMVSIETGFSIGGYDADSICGKIFFGKGAVNELYEGIGRGELNIENLPVFRDEIGAFGTPTSDSVRTMVTTSTKRFLMIFPLFEIHNNELESALSLSVEYLQKYCDGKNIVSWIE